MASITITNSPITATSNMLTINYTTDVTLSKVELTKDSNTWITAKTFSQTTATFDISSWNNGTYSDCKLRITYEIVTSYGKIVLSTSTISLNEGSTGTFTVKLDTQPTNNQVVNLSVDNSNCSLDKNSLTFTPSNYSTAQSVTITGAHDSSSYSDKTSTITASSDNVSSKTISVTIKNIDTQPVDTYNITYNLSNCTCNNSAASITGGASYYASINANTGYDLSSITVTMGGTNITSSAVSGSNISISKVTGNIVITASATETSGGTEPIEPIEPTLAITNINGGTFTTSDSATVTYTTSSTVTKHEYRMQKDYAYSDGTDKVTSSGNNHTITFNAGELSAGTKNGSIRVTDANGNTAEADFTMIINAATPTSYTITKNLTNCTCNNNASSITAGSSYSANISANSGYELGSIRVTMGGADITSSAVLGNTISINSVTGNIVITASATKISTPTPTTYTITKNLTNCTCSNSANNITSGTSYSATINANSGYNLSSLTVTMGGTNITSSAVSGSRISISNVTGNIVITASATQQETPSTPSSGSALDDWDAYNNTYGNYVAYMADRVGVNGKAIRMTATATPTTVQGSIKKDYRSGSMVSKKAFKYGTFTFKFKVSANDTLLWPMIWTLPDQTAAQDQLIGKNQRPEYDLLESWGSMTNNSVVQTYHCTTPSGESKMNYLQGRTPVDLTQEHELKLVWTQDNVVKMYCDGVVKVTIKDYVTNWQTGQVDYQVWFINLGLGGFDGTAPNGVGWFEITDYDFQPVYTRDRVKQDYGFGTFSDGTLPSGPLPSSSGSSGGSGGSTPTTYTITNNLTNCASNNSAANITANSPYSATISANSGYTLGSITVTMGGTDITNSAVSGGVISISSVTGNIVITANATEQSSGGDDGLTITNITGGTFTTSDTVRITYTTSDAVTKHEFTMDYGNNAFTDGTARVTSDGNNHTMTFNAGDLSAGTKNGAIKVTDANGNTAIAQYTLVITENTAPTTYTITKNLTNCTCSNSATSISSGSSYSANISANSGYTLGSITVTMGGANITSSAVSGNSISISNVTGNIVITASASQASGGVDPIEPIEPMALTINKIIK